MTVLQNINPLRFTLKLAIFDKSTSEEKASFVPVKSAKEAQQLTKEFIKTFAIDRDSFQVATVTTTLGGICHIQYDGRIVYYKKKINGLWVSTKKLF